VANCSTSGCRPFLGVSLSILLAIAGIGGGCSQGAQTSSAQLEGQSFPSCSVGPEPDLKIKERQEEVKKNVIATSRRLAVDGELELWDTPYGRYWLVANNFNTMADVLGEQAVDIYGDTLNGVHAGDVVLDCGAHFGGFTRKALDRGAKLVVAIEIAPENVQCLRRTFATEIAAGKVTIVDKGVWDKEETMTLERTAHTWGDHVGSSGRGPSVGVTTVDKIVSGLQLGQVDFIKIDIEGAERNALSGAAETMKTHRPRLAVASYHRADDLTVLPSIVLAAQPSYRACLNGRGLGWGYLTLFFR